jgi:regulatory protein
MLKKELLAKAMKYCAYQERCHEEVRTKLLELGGRGEDLEQVMSELIEQNFLNEERFAMAFARGKFRIKKWGIVKIKQELKLRKISDYCIKKALTEIEDDVYIQTIQELIAKKNNLLKEKNIYIRKNKIATFIIGKGFEPAVVWEAVNKKIT